LEDRRVLSAIAIIPAHDLPDVAADQAAPITAASRPPAMAFAGARDLGQLEGTRQITGRVDPTGRRDFYQFTVATADNVTVRLDGLQQDADLYLFDRAGRIVAFSDRAGTREEMIRRTLAPGTYSVLVSAYRSARTSYRLTLSSPRNEPQPADRAGDSFSTARDLGPLTGHHVLSESVGHADRADVYRFRVDGGDRIAIGLQGHREDLDLYLFDAYGRRLARSFRGGTLAESIRGTLGAGEYFVAVVPYLQAASRYDLTLDVSDPAARSPIVHRPARPPVPPTHPTPPPPVAPTPPVTPPPTSPGTAPGTVPGTPQRLPDVPYFGTALDWNVNQVRAPEAWAAGFTGQGIVVAVVDTGVDLNHPDLVNNLWRNLDETPGDGIDNDGNGFVDDVFGWNFADRTNRPQDTNGHGTHVAGTIAAARDRVGSTGLAYQATIMPVRVLGDRGSGSVLDVAAGIRYAVDNGADIINLSLGGGFSRAIDLALQYAQQHDVFVAIAAGNDGGGSPSFPAIDSRALGNTISVGANDRAARHATFSDRVGQSGAVQVDAPGVGIFSTLPNGRYGQLSGTSMASPHVAGVAALALSANPSLTAAQLRDVLVGSADRSVAGSDSVGGIDAALAVSLALADNPASSPASTAAVASSNATGWARFAVPHAATVSLDPLTASTRMPLTPAVASADTDRSPRTEVGDVSLEEPARITAEQAADHRTAAQQDETFRSALPRTVAATTTPARRLALRPELVDRVMVDAPLGSWHA